MARKNKKTVVTIESFDEPQSRIEALLQNILGADYDIGDPQSRNEALLMNILGESYDIGEAQSRIEALLMAIKEQGIGSLTADDLGKVVQETEPDKYGLVAQTAHEEITVNGEYDTTDNNSVTVNVSGGGGGGGAEVAALIERTASEVYNSEATSVGACAFYKATALTGVSLPNVGVIGSSAFQGCTELAAISAASATKISGSAFNGCEKLAAIDFPEVSVIGNNAFQSCIGLKTANLPGVSLIASSVFSGCTTLEMVSLLKAHALYSAAFNGCASLVSVYLMGSEYCSKHSTAFTGTPLSNNYTGALQGHVYVPASLYSQYINSTGASGWSSIASKIVSVSAS